MNNAFPLESKVNVSQSSNQFLSVSEAQAWIQNHITAIPDVQQVDLKSALGRVLAVDVLSPIDVPAHNNSAMDGYAFNGADLAQAPSLNLNVIGEVYAGHPYTGVVPQGSCIKIMTGAVMPDSCDTVVPQEMVTLATPSQINISSAKLSLGDNRRLRGEDLQKGKVACPAGKCVGPAELGLLASLGIAQVSVMRRLRVAYFSTGDEVRSLGQQLDEGCIYDSNRYTVFGMLTKLGCEVIDMGVIKDHPEALELALRAACEQADAIITSGGVSVGAADYTRQVMAKLGKVAFWTIGMRPGRPMAFGEIHTNGHSAYLFGLPGNPVAVMVSFYFFVKQALEKLGGAQSTEIIMVPAISSKSIRKRPGRTEYQRGIARRNASGQLEVSVTGSQGSGVLRSMSEANCMIVLGDEQDHVAPGSTVEIVLFEGLI